ncbi:MAG: lactate dehydrogenase, partial [Acidimicrobiia bacterium]|nr:lactate dehydrogenase [Acidimicrobiia bacterium]
RLQLVGHHGGASETELHGLRADLRDAFADDAPTIEITDDPDAVDADVVVMLAGRTVPTDPRANVDRVALARDNLAVFSTYAEVLERRTAPPLVIVQSNPVELGVHVLSRHLGRHRVLGAGSFSDSLRFRRELADTFGTRRTHVRALMLGQHGDHLVPVWSGIEIDDRDPAEVRAVIDSLRAGRPLSGLADEIVAHRAELLDIVARNQVHAAFARAAELPPDIRAAVKAFLVHTTAGHTTEIVTAHAVAELVGAVLAGTETVVPAQVRLDGELDLHGVLGMTVRLTPEGWNEVIDPHLADDEHEAMREAQRAIDGVLALAEESPD